MKPVRIESLPAALVDRGHNFLRAARAACRRRRVLFVLAVLATAASVAVADAAGLSVAGFGWFGAAPAPAGWRHAGVPSGGGVLFYPPSFVGGSDKDGISRERLGAHGAVLVYLDVTPKQGNESLSSWPSYRLAVVRAESIDVHEDGHAYGLHFTGGTGSCVLDDYRTKVKNHQYREIACFVHGRSHASVLIAAALQSQWAQALTTLERAVDAYRVS